MAEKLSINYNPVTEGVLWKEMIKFFLPLAGGSIIQQLYNMADAIIVGQFIGKVALASVGGAPATISAMIVYIINGLSNGAAVKVSQFYGARRDKKVDTAMHTALAFSLLLGVAICILGLITAGWMLNFMKTPESIYDTTMVYLKIFFIGVIPTSAYNMGSAIMRAIGDSKRPFYYLIVCSVLNIALDIVFVCFIKMGVVGAAVATVISQTISAALVFISLAKGYERVHFAINRLHINPRMLIVELRIGAPAALMSVVYGITNILIQTDINVLGTDTIAAWAAYAKVDTLFWSCNSAFGIVASTFVAQNYGAGKTNRVFNSVKQCTAMAVIVCGMIAAGLMAFCHFLFGLFTGDASVIEIGTFMIRYLAPTYMVYVFIEVFTGSLRGLGDINVPTIATLASLFFVRFPWLLLYFPHHSSLKVLLFSYPSGWIPLAIFLIGYYFYRKKHSLKLY